MKKILFMAMMMATVCLSANAQHFRDSRYYNPRSGRLNYSQRGNYGNGYHRSSFFDNPNNYVGLRIGASFSNILDGDNTYGDGDTKTGLNLGVVAGVSMSRYLPIYFETGLSYTEKGAKYGNMEKCNLEYLEVPLVIKGSITTDGHFAIQPYAGGYLACGVGGKIKENTGGRSQIVGSSFGDNGYYDRFDGGLKVGCGIAYDMLYADLSYEYGLTNIDKNDFYSTHNSALMLNVGVNF